MLLDYLPVDEVGKAELRKKNNMAYVKKMSCPGEEMVNLSTKESGKRQSEERAADCQSLACTLRKHIGWGHRAAAVHRIEDHEMRTSADRCFNRRLLRPRKGWYLFPGSRRMH